MPCCIQLWKWVCAHLPFLSCSWIHITNTYQLITARVDVSEHKIFSEIKKDRMSRSSAVLCSSLTCVRLASAAFTLLCSSSSCCPASAALPSSEQNTLQICQAFIIVPNVHTHTLDDSAMAMAITMTQATRLPTPLATAMCVIHTPYINVKVYSTPLYSYHIRQSIHTVVITCNTNSQTGKWKHTGLIQQQYSLNGLFSRLPAPTIFTILKVVLRGSPRPNLEPRRDRSNLIKKRCIVLLNHSVVL